MSSGHGLENDYGVGSLVQVEDLVALVDATSAGALGLIRRVAPRRAERVIYLGDVVGDGPVREIETITRAAITKGHDVAVGRACAGASSVAQARVMSGEAVGLGNNTSQMLVT